MPSRNCIRIKRAASFETSLSQARLALCSSRPSSAPRPASRPPSAIIPAFEAFGHRILVDCGEGTQRQLLRVTNVPETDQAEDHRRRSDSRR
jgi:hypothetical protein